MSKKETVRASFSTLRGAYPTREAYESGFLGSLTPRSCSIREDCEFSDYCNHLFYQEDRCDCVTSWKKTPGLVVPTSH